MSKSCRVGRGRGGRREGGEGGGGRGTLLSCPACTFLNTAGAESCDMCDGALPVLQSDCKGLEEILGYQFRSRSLLEEALTHVSYANIHRCNSYERLELFGDSILSFLVTEYLDKEFPNATVGEIATKRTSLVNNKILVRICRHLHLHEYVRVAPKTPIAGKMLADLVEAVIGAMFKDGGLDPVRTLLQLQFFNPNSAFILEAPHPAKNRLQEFCEKRGYDKPVYVTELLPDTKQFESRLRVNGRQVCLAVEDSKQAAEILAAEQAMANMDALRSVLQARDPTFKTPCPPPLAAEQVIANVDALLTGLQVRGPAQIQSQGERESGGQPPASLSVEDRLTQILDRLEKIERRG